jgi:hypothetical protein
LKQVTFEKNVTGDIVIGSTTCPTVIDREQPVSVTSRGIDKDVGIAKVTMSSLGAGVYESVYASETAAYSHLAVHAGTLICKNCSYVGKTPLEVAQIQNETAVENAEIARLQLSRARSLRQIAQAHQEIEALDPLTTSSPTP